VRYGTIRLEIDAPVATIRLHRPERMNAVVEAMYREIADALTRIENDPELRCAVLTGTELHRGEDRKQAFCAGADLKEHGAGRRGPAERRAYIELAHETVHRLFTSATPVVAAVNGPARGAGVELALACDLVLMADTATLALPETGLGTFVGGGVTWVLPRLVGLARARELIYTGRVLDGPAAVDAGLALRSVPLDRLEAETRELAATVATKAPVSIRLAKRLLNEGSSRFDAALADETEAILACMETEDWAEGVRAFAEKRAPRYRGR